MWRGKQRLPTLSYMAIPFNLLVSQLLEYRTSFICQSPKSRETELVKQLLAAWPFCRNTQNV